MPVDEQAKALLDAVGSGKALYELDIAEARKSLLESTLNMDAAPSDIGRSEDRSVSGPNGNIPVRIYWPKSANTKNKKPALLLYHGGGFALGGSGTHENVSRYYCAHADVIVVNVDYRLSPEHKFPAGIEDSYAALCWVSEHANELGVDSTSIAVIGDSAGGNISAVMCQLSKARNGPKIAAQILLYPEVSMDENADYPSRREFGGGGYFLSYMDLAWLKDMYFSDPKKEWEDLKASPILSNELENLPAALIITAGNDMLRDEGKHYAERLTEAGVPVEYKCFDNTIHGFMAFSGALDAGKEGLALVVEYLQDRLHMGSNKTEDKK